jgi:anti-sigma regulatory factor (Ser/Thr protein kinase)
MRRMRTFPAIPQSVHAARRFATDTLVDSPSETLEAVELMVSELATNCIRHERASFHIAIRRSPREIRVEVTDSGSGTPTMRSPAPSEPSGRGLQIVDMLSDGWGVEQEFPTGKTVWFTLSVSSPSRAAADRASEPREQADNPRGSARLPSIPRRRGDSAGRRTGGGSMCRCGWGRLSCLPSQLAFLG